VFGSIATIALPLSASAATYDTVPIPGLSNPWGIAFDAAGDLFVANNANNSITVLPEQSGMIFGQAVTAGVAVTVIAATGLNSPSALVFDSSGDLFIGNSNNSVTVLPQQSGTLFGQGVSADTAVALTAATGFNGAWGLAFDAAGDLFGASEGNSSVIVLPVSSGTIFGKPVTADVAAVLLAYPNVSGPTSLAFDPTGDLFVASIATNVITVDPAITRSIFGQSVTANTPVTLNAASGLAAPWAMAFDPAGDLFVANDAGTGSASVLPVASGTLFGQAVTANTATTFLGGQDGIYYSYGLAFDAAGDLYSSNQGNSTVTELLAPPPDVPQTIGFTSTDPSPTYGSTYAPAVSISPMSAQTPAPVFSVGSSSGPGVCAISAGVVTFTKVGTCVIDADVASSGSLEAASVSQIVAVIPAAVSVIASSANIDYGNPPPAVTPQINGLVNGDPTNKLGVIICSTSATATSPAGVYPTSCSGGGDPNYSLTYLTGEVTVDAVAPGPPTSVTATPGDGSVTATWTAPSSTGGAPIIGYTVAAIPQGGDTPISQSFPSTATTETLTGLVDSTPYDVSVAALNADYAADGSPADASDNPVTPESSTQTITFTSPPPVEPALSSTYTPSATGGSSGNAVVFTIGSETTDQACSITAGVVSFDHSGTCVIDANQAAGGGFDAAIQVQQFILVGQDTPVISWPSPAAIPFGTPLGSSELDATASVPGTFTYVPAAGTVLAGGTRSLDVTFTPVDSADYVPASASTSLTVDKQTPPVTWATPAPITYGTALSGEQLDATASVSGTFSYSPALGNIEAAGNDTITATFTPTDSIDYSSVTTTVALTVEKQTPPITWATPAPITYGTALSANQLDATANVAGTFSYQPAAGTVPDPGSHTLSVKFTPSDTSNDQPVTKTISLEVDKATPNLAWPAPAAITYGTALSSAELDATSSAQGTFTYTPALGVNPVAGTATLTATFSPANTADYASGTVQTTLVVNQATPTITWPAPAAISAGTALSADELDASASVPGTFTYSPAAGSTPAAGTTTLSVNFTPTDVTDYASTMQTTSLVINPAATVTAPPPSTTSTTIAPSADPSTLPAPPSGSVNIDFAIQPGIAITEGKVRVHGHGFRPGSTVTIVAHSSPRLLGTAVVKKDGTFSDVVGLPAGLPVGGHHIIVSGTLQNGSAVAQQEAFTVATGGLLGTVGSVPPGPLASDVAFVPTAHRATVLATAAGGSVAIGAVASSLGGGFSAARSGGTGGLGGGSTGGGGGGYLEDVELEREEADFEGGSRGDRSRTWRWPWTGALDRFSARYPSRTAAVSPVAGRVLVDGDYLRAMFGSLWLLMCLGAMALGSYASASTGWYAIPPSLTIFVAVLAVSILDSTLGYLAGLSFFASALLAGHVTSAVEARTGAGIVLLWFAVPLAAAALRPLRRSLSVSLVGLWDRVADLVIGGLFAAWAAEKMTGALSGLAGVELPIAKDLNTIAFAVLGFVGLRIILETIAAHHYPKRLEHVKHRGGLESENLQVGLSLIVQIVLFLFISVAFMGSTWGLYVGAVVFFSPLVPWLFADKIPKSRFVTKWKPTGLVNWTLIIVAGVALSRLLDHLVHSDHLVEVLGFILLPLPVLASWALELFEVEEEESEDEDDVEGDGTGEGSRERLDSPDGDGPSRLPVLAYAGSISGGEASRTMLADVAMDHDGDGFLEAESARSKFRAGQEERDEAREATRSSEARWKAWLTRLAGVPLVVVSVYLVVTHIAGG